MNYNVGDYSYKSLTGHIYKRWGFIFWKKVTTKRITYIQSIEKVNFLAGVHRR